MKIMRFFQAMLTAIVLVFAGSMLSACGGLTVKDIIIKSGFPTEIVQNGTLDISNVSATVVFSDDTTKDITSADLTVTIDTSIVGNVLAIVKYQDFEKQVTVEVYSPTEIRGINATAYSGTYDGIAHDAITGITGTQTGDSISYSIAETPTPDDGTWVATMPTFTNAGTHNVSVRISRTGFDHKVINKTVNIAKATLTAKADDLTIDYLDAIPTYTISYTGFVAGEDATAITTLPTANCSYTVGGKESSYPITVVGGEATNYTFSYVPGTLTVNGTQVAAMVTNYTPHLLEAYEGNTDNTKRGEQERFVDTDNPLTAGDDNAFDLQLSASVLIDDDEETVAEFETNIAVAVFDGTAYNTLDATGRQTYFDEIDNIKNTLNFSTAAVGKTFKITVFPKNTDPLYNLVATDYIVRVVDGYNVYDANDLSIMTNVNGMGWDAWKQEKGYAGITAKALVLQKKINVTDANIPAGYFYNTTEAAAIAAGTTMGVEIVGSLKDTYSEDIYVRTFAENDQFAIYGNYFQIDYSALSRIVVTANDSNKKGVKVQDADGNGEGITIHTALMRFKPVDGAADIQKTTMNVFINDVDFKGNGARSTKVVNSGGAILAKLNCVNVNVENSMYRDCIIGWFFDYITNPDVAAVVKDSKGYNSYNTLMYACAATNVSIIGGEYIGAGGPVLIADHSDGKKDGSEGTPTHINVIGSKFESLVTGYEPWFVDYGATALVPQILQLNQAYTQAGATFLQDKDSIQNLLNLKVVYKSGSAEGLTSYKVRGNVQFYESMTEYENATKPNDPVAPVHRSLDLDTYSSLAVNNGSHILMNSRTGKSFSATQYVFVGQELTGQPEIMLVRLSDMLAFQEAGNALNTAATAYFTAKATYEALQAQYEQDPTNTTLQQQLQQAVATYQTAGQAYQLANVNVCSFFCGQYVGATYMDDVNDTPNDATDDVEVQAGLYIGGTLNAGYDLSQSFLDGTKLSLAKVEAGQPILNGTNPIAAVEATQIAGHDLLTFNILNPENGYATVENTGSTHLNFYISNGMAIVLELYKLEA